MSADVIKVFGDKCVECPLCGSQLFYVMLCDDLESVDRLECGGFDNHGKPCPYQLPFEDEEIELTLE